MTEPRYQTRPRTDASGPTVVPPARRGLSRRPVARSAPERFPYGWRWRKVRTASGETELQQVPLTYEDLLNPQEGDEMGQDSLHVRVFVNIFGILRRRYPDGSRLAVFGDLIAYLAGAGSKAAVPDVWVARGVKDPGRRRGSFDQAREGGDVVLAIEIVSPRSAEKDYKYNLDLYERAGVEEYLVVEAEGEYLSSPVLLTAYRLSSQGRYQAIKPNPQGRVLLSTVGLLVGPDRGGWGLEVLDARTGERLLTGDEAEAARQVAEAARHEEAAARQAAERRAAEEAAARQEAEQRVAEEAAARHEEAAARHEEAAARQAAERRAAEEAAARQEAEQRAAALAAELERLKASS